MTDDSAHREFGAGLRQLRTSRGLTLQQVASASTKAARDSSGRISQPYLSQLERGNAPRINTEKLRTLAAVYDVHPSVIAQLAPTELRRQIADGDSTFVGRHVHDARLGTKPPEVTGRIDDAFADMLNRAAIDVAVPLGQEGDAFRIFRNALWGTLLAADLHRRAGKAIPGFWEFVRPSIDGLVSNRWSHYITWVRIVDHALNWHFYECQAGLEAMRLVSGWTYQYPLSRGGPAPTPLVGCRFVSPDLAGPLDHWLVPEPLISAIRTCQIANILNDIRPRNYLILPDPPEPGRAVRECIQHLTGREALDHCGADIAASVRAFLAAVNQLGKGSVTPLGDAFVDAAPLIGDAIKRAQRQPDQAKPRRRKR